MHINSFKWTLALSLILPAKANILSLSDIDKQTNLPVGNGYIIEVESSSNILQSRSSLPHELVYSHLVSRGVDFTVLKEFNTPSVFVGASISLQDAFHIEKLREVPGIIAVRPILKMDRPKPQKIQLVSSTADHNIPADTLSTHRMTGVDKLHAEGHNGTGVTIGIIDTGIDYTHPALGGKFGPGNLVIGGYDFVGDDYNGANEPIEDNDPLTTCDGHGTHVAGIVAALPDNDLGISGVAYGASINAYRIFGCVGGVSEDIIVDALLKAYEDGNDVLTLSLGNPDGWTEATSSVVASRIAATGKIVTIAAGNMGDSGAWFTSSPGNGVNVISVGSVNNLGYPIQTITVGNVNPPHDPIPYYELFSVDVPGTRPIYATSTDSQIPNDACDPLPDSTPDLAPYVVVIRRGMCSFASKLDHAREKGATAVLIYNNVPGLLTVDWGAAHANFPVVLIPAEDGTYLVNEFAANSSITLNFPKSGGSGIYPDERGGLMSGFSSYGPTNDVYFKPAISAPGGTILSTWPTNLGDPFAVLSGTSMAAPFVAGVSALLFEVKGRSYDVGVNARNLFESTASPILLDPSVETLQTLAQQGTGLIQAYHAIMSNITLSPTELLLNDTANFKGSHVITLTNHGQRTMDFKVTHIPAATADTIKEDSILPNTGPVPVSNAAASVELSETIITVSPGTSQTVQVDILPPDDIDASTFPVYSGYIQFSSGTESYRASYMGVAAALKDKQIIDNSDTIFGVVLPILVDGIGEVQEGPTNYTFEGSDYPTIIWRGAFGTPHVLVDLVDESVDFIPTYPTSVTPVQNVENIPVVGSLFEISYISRNAVNAFPYNGLALQGGEFPNRTVFPSGRYRVLLRSLRVTGKIHSEEDYESWLSPPIIVDRSSELP